MEEFYSHFFAIISSLLGGAIITLIKMYSDLQGLKKDVTKLEKDQDADDVRFTAILEAITEIKSALAVLTAKTEKL